jgi:hypothetical protein
VHPALSVQLAHRGVDHGVAGAALLPGGERLVVVLPLERVHPLLVGAVGVARVVEEHVGIEVAPGQLADEGLRVGLALELTRADAAEVQVGRELRGAAGQQVVPLLVVVETVAHEGVHAGAGGLLSGRADRVLERALGVRELADADVRRKADRTWRAVDLAPRQLAPGAPEGREDRVRLRLADVGDEVAGVPARLDARLAERRLDPAVARHGERRHVGGEVDAGGVRFARELRQLALGRADANHEVGAPGAQRLAQLAQRLEQEPTARLGREAAVQQPLVEHEDRHDALGLAHRGGQGGVVVDAQIPAHPHDRCLGDHT